MRAVETGHISLMWICPEGYVQLISLSGTSYVAASLVTIHVSLAYPYLTYTTVQQHCLLRYTRQAHG